MCAFCAMMADGSVHWTEAGTDAGQSGAPESGRERYLGRLRRVSLVNRILDHYGCQASDWANNQYVVQQPRRPHDHGGAPAPGLGGSGGNRRAPARPPGPGPARCAAPRRRGA